MPLMQLLIDRLNQSCRTPDKDSRRAPERRVRPLRRTARPGLEHLEGRCVPSTLRVTHDLNVHAPTDLTGLPGTLEWAVANAQNGDTILLTADVERTGITLTQGELILTQQNLTIETEAGKAPVTISGHGLSRVFELAPGAQVTLSNVNITGGNGVANNPATVAPDGIGGGIVVDTGAALTVSGSTVSGNQADGGEGGLGGGIFVDAGAALTVSGSTISGNGAGYGGGIYNFGGTVAVTGSTLASNGATSGGGIYNYSGTLAVGGSAVSGNVAGFSGGGVENQGGTVTITSSTLAGNSAGGGGLFGGGGIDNDGGTVTISGSTLSGNSSGGFGGGIFNAGALTLSASNVTGNSANEGGGVYNTSSTGRFASLTISGSTVAGNTAGFDGGGIFNDGGALVVSGSTVSGNAASNAGGGIFNIAVTAGAYALISNSSTVSGNRGTYGADVYNLGLSVLYLDNSSTIGVLYGNPAMLI
jgi:hypothetical protein